MEKSFEIIPDYVSKKDIVDESNRRSAKVGYTTRLGECPNATRIQTIVPFGKEKLNIWPRNEKGELIE